VTLDSAALPRGICHAAALGAAPGAAFLDLLFSGSLLFSRGFLSRSLFSRSSGSSRSLHCPYQIINLLQCLQNRLVRLGMLVKLLFNSL
jgi:hypothetical protein